MGLVEVNLSMSLDGYVTGPEPDAANPLGVGGAAILRPGGERWMVDEVVAAAGAVVAGRRTYDHVDGWGEEPPFRMPVFVPTHRPRDVRVAGDTTFTFVADVETAVAMAKEAAGDKNVYIMGGASTANQALRAGLVDELNLHIEPVLLGGGAQLFADLGRQQIRLERTRLIEGPNTTHVRFRVLR
ncbi:dihydrofolate reductase family protein [Kibdelosporangium aridum]|uniref:Dihydrofolate reductase n=1 Tax=Kibdelosporangium aridum TaxID=2030 RepID=A0A1Y5Y7Z8_KIBAR|nr:dihydrofolate reductase family protein [Kibdelosporangium aridum]SMD26988.1 Dihydrofolate reductase [Kibdelosporangium aridum]